MTDYETLVSLQANLERFQRLLSKLENAAATGSWPHAQRDAVAASKDIVADQLDRVAASFDTHAERRDEDAVSRQVATDSRQRDDRDSHPGPTSYTHYMNARDREGTTSDRADAASDRGPLCRAPPSGRECATPRRRRPRCSR